MNFLFFADSFIIINDILDFLHGCVCYINSYISLRNIWDEFILDWEERNNVEKKMFQKKLPICCLVVFLSLFFIVLPTIMVDYSLIECVKETLVIFFQLYKVYVHIYIY